MFTLNAAQLVGLIGFLVGVTGFLRKKDKDVRLHMAFFGWVMTAHFLMLGSATSAIGTFTSGTRSYVSIKTQSIAVAWAFIALLWLMAIPNIGHFTQMIPLIGTSIATYGFFKTSGLTFRLLLLLNSCCWLFNNILVGSIGGILSEATFLSMNLIMIVRMYYLQAADQQVS